MKIIKLLPAFLILFTAIGFVSCESEPVDPVFLDYEEENDPEVTGGSFTVNIDGEAFTATMAQASIAEGVIAIAGAAGTNGENVSILVGNTAVGTYNDALLVYTPSAASEFGYWNYNAEGESTGSVTITNIDTENQTISGVFNFTGYWSNDEEDFEPVMLTNGTFTNIPYTGSLENNDGEYLKANIDGVDKSYNTLFALTVGDNLNISGSVFEPNEVLQLRMPLNITPGTYQFGNDISDDVSGEYNTPDISYESVSGTLTIISNENGVIKGEFEFTAAEFFDETDTIEITNGEFNVGY